MNNYLQQKSADQPLMAKDHYGPATNVAGLCSPLPGHCHLENHPPGGPWLPPALRQQQMPLLMPVGSSDQLQLHHRLSVNVTDHYEWSSNPANYFHGMPPPPPSFISSSSNFDTMSLNGSTSSSSIGGKPPSPYPLPPPPMQTVFFNPYHQQRQQVMSPGDQQQQPPPYFQPPPMPTVFFPQAMSPRMPGEQHHPTLVDGSSNKFVGGQAPFVFLSPPPPHPLVGQGPPQPVPGFHPISMVPVRCSSAGPNVYLGGQQFMPMQQQQTSSPIPLFYSTSPPITPWLPAPPPAYFMVPNAQQHAPFQQLI